MGKHAFFFGMIVIWFAGVLTGGAQTLAEALDTTNLAWTTGGDAVWMAQTTNTYDGVDAVRSGIVYSNQTSWLETTVVGPATISFWSFTQSDLALRYSFTRLSITNNFPPPFFPLLPVLNSLSWGEQTYDLAAGTNVLRWLTDGTWAGSENDFVCLDDFTVSPPRPLAFQYQPVDSTAYTDGQIVLQASAVGTPPIYFQWCKNGTNIAGATNVTCFLTALTTNDIGNYSVVVTNSQGQITSSNALITILPPSAPFFTYEPADLTAYTGQSLQLSANVDGSSPFVYQWQKNNTNLARPNDSFLLLANISPADAGNYTLSVSNAYGGVVSSNFALTVISSVAPVITHQPRSLEVATGVNTWLTLAATGTPTPGFDWHEVGEPPATSPFPPSIMVFNSDSTHKFNYVTTNDAGIYFSAVSNYAGGVISEGALLTVLPAITNVSSWAGDALDIAVTNHLAFLARGTNGLAILDVSQPATPQLVGTFSSSNYIQKIDVVGGLVFAAEGSAGLEIISVTNPASPVLVGAFHTPNYASDVMVRSNLAYLAVYRTGLLILNVSNSTAPFLLGSLSTSFDGYAVGLSGKYAVISSPFVAIFPGTNTLGLYVIDISDPTHPLETGSLGQAIGNFDIRDQCVFGVVYGSLDIITITNPAQPAVIGTFNSYYISTTNPFSSIYVSASTVRIVNDYAFLAGNANGQSRFFAVDVRDPAQPIPVGYYTSFGQPFTLAVDGNYAFLAGDQSLLETIGIPFDTRPVGLPGFSVSKQTGMALHIQGRRGLHYDVECADQLNGAQWHALQTILLTNDNTVIEVPSGSVAQFFRLKQLD